VIAFRTDALYLTQPHDWPYHHQPGDYLLRGQLTGPLVAPTTVWWPHAASRVHSFYLKSMDWYCVVDQHLYNLPSVKYVYCSSGGNTTLYLRAAGPDYENLYNAGADEALEHDNYHRVKK